MNNRPEPVLHIGYHKTGTTWMQRVLFHPDFGFAQVTGHEEVSRHITAPHTFEFDAPGHGGAFRAADRPGSGRNRAGHLVGRS